MTYKVYTKLTAKDKTKLEEVELVLLPWNHVFNKEFDDSVFISSEAMLGMYFVKQVACS